MGGSMVSMLGLALLAMSGFTFNPRVLLLFAPFLLVGILLDIVSKRLLWIRVYQIIAMMLPTISFPAFLLYDLYNDLAATDLRYVQITSTVIILSILGTITLAFVQTLRDPLRKLFPHGALGRLDNRTGVVYPEQMPSQAPDSLVETQTRTQAGLRMVARLTPIIAGLAMLSIRAFSNFDILQILKPFFFLLAIFGALGIGSYSAYMVTINRWEMANNKKMYVKM